MFYYKVLLIIKKAEKAVSTLTVHDLNRETGLDVLIEKLDNAFKDEIVENTHSIYLKFTNRKKQPSMSMNDYSIEFENLNHQMSIHNMVLPDTVLAFKILEGAMINDNQRQMALTLASELSFKSMKSALKRIFGEKSYMKISNDDNISNKPIVKKKMHFIPHKRSIKKKTRKINSLTNKEKFHDVQFVIQKYTGQKIANINAHKKRTLLKQAKKKKRTVNMKSRTLILC